MAEYIEREEAIELLSQPITMSMCLSTEECHHKIAQQRIDRYLIENIPAADVRPVVRCRDCKHKGWVQEPEHGKSVDYCRLIERCVDKQFFCAAGKKREES